MPDFNEVVGDEGRRDDDDAVPGDGDQPLRLLQEPSTGRFRVSTLAPVEVFQFLEQRKIFVNR